MSGVNTTGGAGFNYQQVTETMGQSTSTTESNLKSFSANMDPSNSGDMIKLQNLTQQWTMAVSLQSTTIKMIGDALKGIVQKVG